MDKADPPQQSNGLPGVAASPRGNVRWLVAVMIFLGVTIAWIDRANLSVAAPAMTDELALTPGLLGIAFGTFSLVQVLSQPLGGWAADRWGTRVVFAAAGVSWFVFTAATALVRGAYSLIFVRILLGIGEGPQSPAALKAATEWFPKRERAMAIGFYQVGSEFGPVLALPVITAVIAGIGWRGSFVVAGALGLVWAIAWFAFYRLPQHHKMVTPQELAYIQQDQDEAQAARAAAHVEAVSGEPRVRWRDLFGYRSVWGVLIVMFCRSFIIFFFVTWYPTYLVSEKGFTLLQLGTLGMVPGIAAILGNPIGGAASSYLMARGVNPGVARKAPMLVGLAMGTTMLLAAFSASPMAALVFLSIASAGVSIASAPVWSLAADIAPTPGTVASLGGLLAGSGAAAGFIAPTATGFLIAVTDAGFVAPLVAGSILMVVAILAAVCMIGDAQPLRVRDHAARTRRARENL